MKNPYVYHMGRECCKKYMMKKILKKIKATGNLNPGGNESKVETILESGQKNKVIL